jgi:L-lactate dehydrogenase complex protein LldG
VTSREKILNAVKLNQPAIQELPVLEDIDAVIYEDVIEKFGKVLESIGGKTVAIDNEEEIVTYLQQHFTDSSNYSTTVPAIKNIKQLDASLDPHTFENIEVAVIPGLIGVAENGAVWVTENEMKARAFPFICQHLAIVLQQNKIVSNMHEAYASIGLSKYEFGVFIAGPSKTADIEQSLVLGAHGARSLTVFLIK